MLKSKRRRKSNQNQMSKYQTLMIFGLKKKLTLRQKRDPMIDLSLNSKLCSSNMWEQKTYTSVSVTKTHHLLIATLC